MTNYQPPNGPQDWQGNPNQQQWYGQPYPQQNWQGQPYPQQQSAKKRGGCIKWFLIFAVALVILFIVVAAVSGSGNNESSNNSQGGEAGVPEGGDDGQEGQQTSDSTVRFEVETSDGSSVSVTYTSAGDGASQAQDNAVASPWSKEITVGEHDMLNVNVLAQQDGSGEVSCRILVNGEEVNTNTSTGPYSIATCNFSDFLR